MLLLTYADYSKSTFFKKQSSTAYDVDIDFNGKSMD